MKLVNVNKVYEMNKVEALKDINVEFNNRTMYAIMGRSGSGKTTLVNILGLLDNPTSGEYYIDDKNLSNLNDEEKSKIRGLKIGFVFQSYYLNPKLTAIENVILPTYINPNIKKEERINIGMEYLKKFNLENRANHYPKELSGGEQQRVAIARALINNPDIIIADEPTGNLDSKSELEVFEILKNISLDGKTVIVVSHNAIIKNYCDELYIIEDGVLTRGIL